MRTPIPFTGSTVFLRSVFIPTTARPVTRHQFRILSEAYQVLCDPERRAQYDVVHSHQRQDRWRLVANSGEAGNEFEIEQRVRLTALEVLYTRRRTEPESPGLTCSIWRP